ncbi:sulfotransferase domain-containing protein [Paractinoplanes toevensis]|uniref:Sulfotransferase n=1 Tax=Paractinoplanes toevensis TaxID=571911 RepID=A0A919WD58_9ACTN|nr:sulfotransferase domain-containing protein [Actinoplanes toevensis]GIM98060.1 sulfotransferase [Actinoplanes toevensis]
MLVWVASFPRSGNTLLRIALHRRYGVTSSVVYDHDGVAGRLGGELIGYTERPGSLAEMRAAAGPHFVKTHRPRDEDVDDADAAICLVRDGRDALVSWARLLSEDDPASFPAVLRRRITDTDGRSSASWGTNVLSWLRPAAAHRVVLSYAELIADPAAAADRVMAVVAPGVRADLDAVIPRFEQLRQVDAGFFRRGVVGSHRDEFPPALLELFWSRPDNRAAMQVLAASGTS